jgi:hypothetical protein
MATAVLDAPRASYDPHLSHEIHGTHGIDDAINLGALVVPVGNLPWVCCIDGGLVSTNDLGVGVVEELLSEGKVHVHWEEEHLDAWVSTDKLRLFGVYKPGNGL